MIVRFLPKNNQLWAFHMHPVFSCLIACEALPTVSCIQGALPLPHLPQISSAFSFCFMGHHSRWCQPRLHSQLLGICWPVQYSALAYPCMRLFIAILGRGEQSSLKCCSLTHQKSLLQLHARLTMENKAATDRCYTERYRHFRWAMVCNIFFPFQYANRGLLVKRWMKHTVWICKMLMFMLDSHSVSILCVNICQNQPWSFI